MVESTTTGSQPLDMDNHKESEEVIWTQVKGKAAARITPPPSNKDLDLNVANVFNLLNEAGPSGTNFLETHRSSQGGGTGTTNHPTHSL